MKHLISTLLVLGTVTTLLGQDANTKLSNLAAPTAVNADLLPGTTNTRNLGSVSLSWKNLYLNGDVYLDGTRFMSNYPGTTSSNVFVGSKSGFSITTGVANTATGFNSLYGNTSGVGNSAYGNNTLYSNITGNYNTAHGSGALYKNVEGYDNVANGANALYNNISGVENTAIGTNALFSNDIGNDNTAVGSKALQNSKAHNNTAIGTFAMSNYNTGSSNTAIGRAALASNTTGSENTAIGLEAMLSNTTGSYNTAIGKWALVTNSIGNYNTANGYEALAGNTTGYQNVASGYRALYNNISGYKNTANGTKALFGNTNGAHNTAYGVNALSANSTGSLNTGLGYYADLTTGSLNNATALGFSTFVDASDKVRIGNTNVTRIGGQVSWSVFSDGRYKKGVKEDVHGLDFINSLRPITYTVDIKGLNLYYSKFRNGQDEATEERVKAIMREGEEKASKVVYSGFIAQEVEEVANKLDYQFSGVDKPDSKEGLYGLRYSDFVVPLVKAVQELDKKTEEISILKQELAELRQMVLELKKETGNSSSFTSIYLEQNSPNPTSSTTVIRYYIPQNSTAASIVFTDMKGAIIQNTTLKNKGAGQLNLNTAAWTAGTYTYTLYINGIVTDSKKLVIAR